MQFKTSLRIAALLLAAAAGVRAAQVRPLSEGERAAVQTSAAYLSRGAEAVYEQLAPSSPLLKLRKEDALAEIETRLGPPAGATFELQTVVPALKDDTAAFTISYPSGIDETAVFEMTPDNRIANLRILAEPSLNAPPFPPEKATDTTAAEPENGPSHVPLLLGMLAAFLGIVAASILKLNATAAKSILAVCVLLAAGGGWLGLHDDPRLEAAPKAAPATAEKTYPRIGSLLPLRRILAAGVGDVDAAYRQVAIGGFAKDVATLWKAQYDLQQMKLPEGERALKALPSPSATPLPEILRGRAAFEQAKEINTAGEATFASANISSRPIVLPDGALPRVSGDFLDVAIGQQELQVPGGAVLAPQGTPVVDAGLWERSEQQKGLQDFTQLLSIAHSSGAYGQPLLRRRIVRFASALAEHNRWNDLLQLTEGIDPTAEHVPSDIFFLRDVALQRAKRIPEAKLLLGQYAQSPVLKRKNNQQLYAEIGEMLAQLDEYDAAVKLLDRATNARQSPFIDSEVTKVQMNKRLATKYNTVTSPHFVIHYPDDVSEAFAKQMADVMESELKRVQKWVPVPNFQPTVVNMLWYQDFRDAYTGGDFILGFYQGKITVPLAGAPDFIPQALALLTHELTHAMLDQATNGQAPSWFHECLAQRTEMAPFKPNAFNMYNDSKLLSVSVLDAVLHGSPDPEMIGEAYIVAQTVIRYIEATYGQAGLAKMIAAYREGATTDEAIQRLSGVSVAEFDTRLRAWGRTGTKVFENKEFVSYEHEQPDDIHWTRQGGHR